MPGSRPVEGKPAFRLVRSKCTRPLGAADWISEPSIDWNFPDATIARSCSQDACVRVVFEILDQDVWQPEGKRSPVCSSITRLVYAEIGRHPDAIGIRRMDLHRVDR